LVAHGGRRGQLGQYADDGQPRPVGRRREPALRGPLPEVDEAIVLPYIREKIKAIIEQPIILNLAGE
jgi:hypothetical protein